MKIEEKDILYHTILHSCEYKDNGLMYGKMGVALSLAMYAKVHNCKPVEDFADELLESVLLNLSKHTTLGFGQGLAGIGWGIEYLTQNGFLQIDTTEICKEIDEQIMQINIEKMSDMSLENGLLGLLTYINAHIYAGYFLKKSQDFDGAEKAFKAIDGNGLSRIDFFVEKTTGDIYLNEINTLRHL